MSTVREALQRTKKTEFFEAEYMVRRVKNRHYQVSKWTHGKDPVDVYDVWENPKSWSCNCPVRSNCKHIKMVKQWKAEGEPNDFEPKGELWKNLF